MKVILDKMGDFFRRISSETPEQSKDISGRHWWPEYDVEERIKRIKHKYPFYI